MSSLSMALVSIIFAVAHMKSLLSMASHPKLQAAKESASESFWRHPQKSGTTPRMKSYTVCYVLSGVRTISCILDVMGDGLRAWTLY